MRDAVTVVRNQVKEQFAMPRNNGIQPLLCISPTNGMPSYEIIEDAMTKDTYFVFKLLAEMPYCSMEIH